MKHLMAIFFCFICSVTVAHSAEKYVEGVHYQRVKGSAVTQASAKIKVEELLWYGCKTCFAMQSFLNKWAEGSRQMVRYQRVPAIQNNQMELLARAFYSAKKLGVLNKIHLPLFRAVHEEKVPFHRVQDVAVFFDRFGVDQKRLMTVMNSDSVNASIQHSIKLSRDYGIAGVPTIVISGQYRVDPLGVSSPQEMVDVIDFLVRKVKGSKRN